MVFAFPNASIIHRMSLQMIQSRRLGTPEKSLYITCLPIRSGQTNLIVETNREAECTHTKAGANIDWETALSVRNI